MNAKKEDAKPVKSVGTMTLIIMAVVALVLSIILPLIFLLSMRVDFSAKIESMNQWGEGQEGVIAGAKPEIYQRTVSSEYKAVFVPSRLTEYKGAFTGIAVMYAPLLITGSPLELNAKPSGSSPDLTSEARIRFSSNAPVAIFFIVLLIILFFMDLMLNNPNASLKFVVTLSVLWLLYSLLVWGLGGLMMRTVNVVLNELLAQSQQGAASFSLGGVNAIGAPARIFLIGTLYWVVSFMLRRAKSVPPSDDRVLVKE